MMTAAETRMAMLTPASMRCPHVFSKTSSSSLPRSSVSTEGSTFSGFGS